MPTRRAQLHWTPINRAFLEGINKSKLRIDFAPDSDLLPIWQP